MGERLFDRSSRELSLTEAGKSLYLELGPLIEEVDAVVARHKKGIARTTIRISVQPFFASEYFVPRLSEFTAQHPQIDIQVGTSDESSEKHPADADMSIRLFRSPPTTIESSELFPLRLVPAGSPEFLKSVKLRNGEIISEFPIIVHESLPKAWAQWSRSSGIKLPKGNKVTRLDSMIAVVRAAQRGIGAALVPVPVGKLWFDEGSIVRLLKHDLVADMSYYLIINKDRVGDPSIVKLREWIQQSFADPT